MGKPKIGFYWCASCGGCEESIVDIAEELFTVVGAVDIVLWPVAMDFKYDDVEKLADSEMAAVLINGAIRTSEQEHIAQLLRRKSKIVIAQGACACMGGVVGLANFSTDKEILDRGYKDVPSVVNPDGIVPQSKTHVGKYELELPEFYNTVRSLDQVVDVDYYLPGCPTTPRLVVNAVMTLLSGSLPPKKTVLADTKALCHTCPRIDSKPEKIKITAFKRPQEVMLDPDKCFLEQGVICAGPATRGGCEARCIKGNMPCRGCFGPLEHVVDHGAKMISMIAAMIDANDEEEIKKIIATIPDPAGLFYRYSLSSSLLHGKK